MADRERIEHLSRQIAGLTDGQLNLIERVVIQFSRPFTFRRSRNSDIVTDCVLQDLGDTLRIHHCFSREAFSKDKFEYALERVSRFCGIDALLAPRGNPGHDITIHGIPFSLKTQADKSIKRDYIHISKFMELGRGQWSDQESDLEHFRLIPVRSRWR